MKSSWEKTKGRRTDYIDVHYNKVVIGNHYGTGMTDNAGTCSHEEFLNGKFRGLILERFGEKILEEVIFAVRHSNENPDHEAKRQRIRRIKNYIEEIPIDEYMKNLEKHPDTINGFHIYGNQGGYKSRIESDNTILFYEGNRATIKSKKKGDKIEFQFEFHGRSCVELHDYYYTTGGDNFHVLSPEGKIIFSTEKPYKEAIFGYEIRINRVFRNKDTIFFSYWAFDEDSIPAGLIRYELGKGLTGRIEIVI